MVNLRELRCPAQCRGLQLRLRFKSQHPSVLVELLQVVNNSFVCLLALVDDILTLAVTCVSCSRCCC
jgi:hypothetical protein